MIYILTEYEMTSVLRNKLKLLVGSVIINNIRAAQSCRLSKVEDDYSAPHRQINLRWEQNDLNW